MANNNSSIGFIPLDDRVVVERMKEKEKESLIIIPDSAKEKPMEGLVVAVGSGRMVADEANGSTKRVTMQLKVGDKVLFGKWSGAEVKLGDKEYLIMKESDILGIIE